MARRAAGKGGGRFVLSDEAQRFVRPAATIPKVLQCFFSPELVARMRRHPEVSWAGVGRKMLQAAVGLPVPESLDSGWWKKSRGLPFAGKGSIGIPLDEELAARMAFVPGMDWRGYLEFMFDKFITGVEQGLGEMSYAKSGAEQRALVKGAARDIARAARRVNRGPSGAREQRSGSSKRPTSARRSRGRRRGRPRVRAQLTAGLAEAGSDGGHGRDAERRS